MSNHMTLITSTCSPPFAFWRYHEAPCIAESVSDPNPP